MYVDREMSHHLAMIGLPLPGWYTIILTFVLVYSHVKQLNGDFKLNRTPKKLKDFSRPDGEAPSSSLAGFRGGGAGG